MKRAFTLIEQLAAIALAGLFMLAALSVLGSVARATRSVPEQTDGPPINHVIELIRHDLMQSERIRTSENRLTLVGFASLDPRTMAPTHRPCRIEYRVVRGDGVPRLIRRQTDLDVLGNQAHWEQTVCADIAGIRLRFVSAPPTPTTRPATELFNPAEGPFMPDAVQLSIRPANPAWAPVTRVLCLK